MTPYVASLRVYEPLAAFPAAERRHWEAYAASGEAVGRADGVLRERQAALAALPAPSVPAGGTATDHAFVARVDGVTLVCPWRTAPRSWEALLAFRADLPEEVAEAFVPAPVAEAATAELDGWRRDHPDLRIPLRTSTWQVPLGWFVLVGPEERRLVLGRRRRDEERSLVYRTPMVQARRRVARALAVLRRSLDDGPLVAGVEELGRWLEEFHPRSLVELDYGGLCSLVDDEALRLDESARDVAEALALLADGDEEGALRAHDRVVARWRALAAREHAN